MTSSTELFNRILWHTNGKYHQDDQIRDCKNTIDISNHLLKNLYSWERSVVVTNLNSCITYDVLKKHFELVGAVYFVYLPNNPDGSSKDSSFIEFYTEKDAENALKLNK